MNIDMRRFIKSGYSYHLSDFYTSVEGTPHLYQKCVRDEVGKRYYINVWYYPEGHLRASVSPKAQLYGPDDEVLMDVSLFNKNTPEEIEAEFDHFWTILNLGYYERDYA